MLSRSYRKDLEPNGKVVRCIEDKGNGYLIVTSDIDESNLTEIKY